MRQGIVRGLAALFLLLTLGPGLWAQAPGTHPLSGRRFPQPTSVADAAWLARPERDREEASDRGLRILGITPGSTVADVGAGAGYLTVSLSGVVGARGKVYATDVQPGMLELLRARLARQNVPNVEVVLGAPDNPRLPPNTFDLILLNGVYHEFSQPQAMLRGLRDALKPSGRLVLFEYRAEDPKVPVHPDHKMTVAQAKLEIEAEGLTLTMVNEELPWQHILIFRRR